MDFLWYQYSNLPTLRYWPAVLQLGEVKSKKTIQHTIQLFHPLSAPGILLQSVSVAHNPQIAMALR